MPSPVWTSTLNWTPDLPISVNRLNAYIGNNGTPGNLDYLLSGRPKGIVTGASTYTTTSTSYVYIDNSLPLAYTGTFNSPYVLVMLTLPALSVNTTNWLLVDMEVDGTLTGSPIGLSVLAAGGVVINVSTHYFIQVMTLTTGVAHTFKPKWRVGGTTGTPTANIGSPAPVLMVLEVG